MTQTLSGLWLDSKKKEGKAGSLTTPSGNDSRLQWLLNGFLFVNFLHLVAIWGLSYLNERRQNSRKVETAQSEADEDEDHQGASSSSPGVGGPSSVQYPPSRSSSEGAPDGEHTTSPLLHPSNASSVYQGYGTHLGPNRSPQDTLMGATTPSEVKRGRFFALSCGGTVVFVWVLFFVTSFLKIRSRQEREGRS